MYLKEIKAHGFKSFADKTRLEFDDNITGIVGPNGSGKSNVVDAIRWVLGEQSVKSLRGDGAMKDVIFSGSKSRKALNVATVTLIFDNADKYLKIEFDEVSITRRLYIDGTNEYLINNNQVRLKDITNLFLDTGVAKESFNIISQGKIEEIISTKANDRRTIFEEAAGVLKYKKRKEEALKKLEKTNTNITRANDIVTELNTQLDSLKGQRDKALKYVTLKEDLQQTEIALMANDITNFNSTFKNTKQRIEVLNNELENMSNVNTLSSTKLTFLKEQLYKNDLEIQNISKKLLEQTTASEKLNSQKNILLERKKYEVKDVKLHNNLISLKEEKLKYENNIASLENIFDINNKNLETKEKNESNLLLELSDLKIKKEMLDNQLTNKIREKNNLSLEIEKLNNSIEQNSLLPSSVKAILNNPKLSGIHDVLGNILQIDNMYSLAIQTSLLASTSNIIVDNELAAKEALTYLLNNKLGRATFYPITSMKPRSVNISDIKNLKGFIDVADNLVKYDKQYENIVKNQLGNVLIVDNIDNANIISKKINKSYKVVSLDGQVINVGGSITGGSVIRRNIISEIADLEQTIQKLKEVENNISIFEDKINEVDNDHKIVEDKLYLVKKEIFNLKEFIDVKVNSMNEFNELLVSVCEEITSLDNKLNNVISVEEEKIIESYYNSIKELDILKQNYEQLLNEKSELTDECNTLEFTFKQENTIFNSKNKELKESEILVNRLDVKIDNLLNDLNQTYNITYELACNYKLDDSADNSRLKVNNLKRDIYNLGSVNVESIKDFETVSERFEFLNNQLTDLSNAKNTLLDIISSLDKIMKKDFKISFDIISKNFSTTFNELFKGGKAYLKLTDEDNLLESGIEIIASPPGKKLNSINLLSGGEKTFTAISLLFAILKSRPVPFCILDEVEAALDETNVDSFGLYLKQLNTKTQFILITHKKKTMEYVNNLYGITMQESGVSKLVSVKLEDLK